MDRGGAFLLLERGHIIKIDEPVIEVRNKDAVKILFKIPVRSDVFKASKVIEQVSRMFSSGTTSRAELIKMMLCQQRYCAYEFA